MFIKHLSFYVFMDVVKKIHEHNRKHNLCFDEKSHTYTIDGCDLDSVTTRLKKYFPFDKENIAKEVAIRRGITYQEVLASWERNRDAGSVMHALAEKFSRGDSLNSYELAKVQHVVGFFKDHPNLEVLGCEVPIFSKRFKIAGTVDLILRDKDKVHILDWKTANREILKDDYWEDAVGLDIPHNNYYKYSLQVSTYAAILKEEYGISVVDSMLVHLRNDLSYNKIPAEDLGMYAVMVLDG